MQKDNLFILFNYLINRFFDFVFTKYLRLTNNLSRTTILFFIIKAQIHLNIYIYKLIEVELFFTSVKE